MNMEIRRVSPYIYDVFHGNQWSTHSRVRQTKRNTYVVSGEKMGHAELRNLHEILHPTMPINYGLTVEQTLEHNQILLNNRS